MIILQATVCELRLRKESTKRNASFRIVTFCLNASLNKEEQHDFNVQLQTFLAREVGRLKTDYEAIKGNVE